MTVAGDKHERTIAFADIAIGQIKALRQPAEPRDYELWYTYATGYNPTLNKAINDTLARKGNLNPSEVDSIYSTYLSPARLTDRIDSVGGRVSDEIEHVVSMIEEIAGSTSAFTVSLADARQQLGRSADRDILRTVIEGLVRTTREFERSNENLELRLRASMREIQQLQDDLDAVRHESLTDPLTTLSNRKHFDRAIVQEIARAAEHGTALSLLMIDIDHFKSFNDTFGHLTGDQVLRLVALCVKQNVKGQDVAARYGGEEFAVILPSTHLREAGTVAEHIRRAVMGKELMKRSTGESLGRVTVSIGVATLRPGDNDHALIERGDACLYAAKRAGRNRIHSEEEGGAEFAMQPRVA
jgi:diguanylate cyclase